ncbi:MAG: hypothetical protein Q8730_02575, partial [Sweet potato little leaf phytoplasma]|nr:hypothetical protein [Sweet potato little leaf phytoplasma]
MKQKTKRSSFGAVASFAHSVAAKLCPQFSDQLPFFLLRFGYGGFRNQIPSGEENFYLFWPSEVAQLNYHHLSKVPIIMFEGENSKVPNRRIGLGPFKLKEFDNNNI